MILRRFDSATGGDLFHDVHQQTRADGRERRLDVPARRAGGNGDRPAGESRAGVQLLHDAHDRHAGLLLTGHDGSLDRRRAAITRQERRVHVDQAQPWNRKERVGQHPAECRDDTEVRVKVPQRLQKPVVADAIGLQDGDAVPLRDEFRRRGLQSMPPAARPIRLRHHGGHRVRRREQGFERRDRERGSAEIDDYHCPVFFSL